MASSSVPQKNEICPVPSDVSVRRGEKRKHFSESDNDKKMKSNEDPVIEKEFSVFVDKSATMKTTILKFNQPLPCAPDKWKTLMMKKVGSRIKTSVDESVPATGEGSTFGELKRRELRMKRSLKFQSTGNVPWLLKFTDANEKSYQFKGSQEDAFQNSAYYILEVQNGFLKASPVREWYKCSSHHRYNALSYDEVEKKWDRRNQILNHYSIMVKKRLNTHENTEMDADMGFGDLFDDLAEKPTSGENASQSGDRSASDGEEDEEAKAKKRKPKKLNIQDDVDDGEEPEFISESDPESDSSIHSQSVVEEIDDGFDSFEENPRDSQLSKAESLASTDTDVEIKRIMFEESLQACSLAPLMPPVEPPQEEKKEIPKPRVTSLPQPTRRVGRGGRRRTSPLRGIVCVTKEILESLQNNSFKELQEASRISTRRAEPPERLLSKEASKRQKPQPEMEQLIAKAEADGLTVESLRRYLFRKPMSIADLLKKFKSKEVSAEDRGKVIVYLLRKINPLKQEIHGRLHFHLMEYEDR